MEMFKKHAVDNIWCEPRQDYENIFQLNRITQDRGTLNRVAVMWKSVSLPLNSAGNRHFYHVYQIGKLSNEVLSIKMEKGVWYNANDICNKNSEIIDVYLENGCCIPRNLCWLMMMGNDNFILAVELVYPIDYGTELYYNEYTGEKSVVDYSLDRHSPIIRFYNNDRFKSDDYTNIGTNSQKPIFSTGKRITNLNSFNEFKSAIKKGTTNGTNKALALYWQDGYITNIPGAYKPSYNGKHHYYLWDASIKNIEFISVKELISFDSKVDEYTRKYGIVLNKDYGSIDYVEDVDFYLVMKNGADFKGVLIPRFNRTNIRQLTHNAYSIRADVINALSNSHDFLTEINECHVMVVVRQNATARGLVYQNNRIKDLYKLSRDEVLQAMAGVNSLVPEWEAANLEATAYNKLMRIKYQDMTKELVSKAYGYNASNLYLEQSTHLVMDRDLPKSVNLPLAFTVPDKTGKGYRSVFCFDKNGLLIDYYQDSETVEAFMVKKDIADKTKYIEVFHSEISNLPTETFTTSEVSGDEINFWGYRVYAYKLGTSLNKWEDVTNNPKFWINTGYQSTGTVISPYTGFLNK